MAEAWRECQKRANARYKAQLPIEVKRDWVRRFYAKMTVEERRAYWRQTMRKRLAREQMLRAQRVLFPPRVVRHVEELFEQHDPS